MGTNEKSADFCTCKKNLQRLGPAGFSRLISGNTGTGTTKPGHRATMIKCTRATPSRTRGLMTPPGNLSMNAVYLV